MSNFDFVAPFYDRILRFVFQKRLWKAQQEHLDRILSDDNVLVVGGGTGEILRWLPDSKITYMDASAKMIELASEKGRATFIQGDFLTHQLTERFDWIICPFFLDCFREEDLIQVIDRLSQHLRPTGQLIVTDFRERNLVHRLVVWVMILFFRMVAGLETTKLCDIRWLLQQRGFVPVAQKEFMGGLVFSDIYLFKK